MYSTKSPILFLVFNRLDVTVRVFEAIASIKPGRLYVACDGPRKNRGDEEKVRAVKEYILQHISWPCEVKTLFRDQNLGCKEAVSGAISWFFEQEEMGIILEDDCLPDPTFFNYCDELLDKYKDDPEIMAIGGTNHFDHVLNYPESYHFSKYFHCWGWASWRRAWAKYDINISTWPVFERKGGLDKLRQSSLVFKSYWKRIFDQVYAGKIDTWDYQMSYAVWAASGMCISPSRNLIQNIGFSEGATHTVDSKHKNGNRETQPMPVPLVHPVVIQQNIHLDKLENGICYGISVSNELRMGLRAGLSRIKQIVMSKFTR